MTSIISGAIERIPWKQYLKSQLFKIIGFLILAVLLIGTMIISSEITDLEAVSFDDPIYLIAVVLSSVCFILVLIGFSKIILFDMAEEFGLRDEETNEIVYDFRFFLFAALALSFCSAIYLLLDVFLQKTYLELLPVVIMQWILIAIAADIPGLTDIRGGREFYQTSRNIYFGFFFLVIIVFSVLVFLSILTSLARKRVTSRFKKEEEMEEEKENRRLYKILAWLAIPVINSFLFSLLGTPFGAIIAVIFLILLAWWLYQLLKVIFLIVWRGFKVTAFVTSVNALLIFPLILVLYGLPVISWTIWDLWGAVQAGSVPIEINELLLAALPILQGRASDILSIVQLDFVFITIIATLIVGFAEGFAIVAIFSAIFRGIEVARTGHIIARSPPKVIVISKYLVLLGVWLSFSWNSFVKIMNMLVEYLNVVLPEWLTTILEQYSTLFYVIYESMIIPLSEALKEFSPIFQYIPFLLLPLYFILSGAFKFLSVTLVTPRVKERISVFFLLISTAFVLIITNILGDIYVIQSAPGFTGIRDAPLQSLEEFIQILSSAVNIFHNVEAIAFYAGFLFGVLWVIKQIVRPRKEPEIPAVEEAAEVLLKPLDADIAKLVDTQAETIETTVTERDVEEFQEKNGSFE